MKSNTMSDMFDRGDIAVRLSPAARARSLFYTLSWGLRSRRYAAIRSADCKCGTTAANVQSTQRFADCSAFQFRVRSIRINRPLCLFSPGWCHVEDESSLSQCNLESLEHGRCLIDRFVTDHKNRRRRLGTVSWTKRHRRFGNYRSAGRVRRQKERNLENRAAARPLVAGADTQPHLRHCAYQREAELQTISHLSRPPNRKASVATRG